MNSDRMLERLSQIARREPAPNVEVSFRVVRQIEQARQPVDRPLAILAGLSAAAAAVVLFYGLDAWSSWQDPIAGLLNSMEMVLQ